MAVMAAVVVFRMIVFFLSSGFLRNMYDFTSGSRERCVASAAHMGANQLRRLPLVLHVGQDSTFLYRSNGFAKVTSCPHG